MFRCIRMPIHLVLSAFVFFASVSAYPNVTINGLIWDDFFIVNNDAIKDLTVSSVIAFFTDKNAYHVPGEIYRPLNLISYAVDYLFYGTRVGGYHFTNLVLHGVSSSLLFYFLYLLLSEIETFPEGRNETVLIGRTGLNFIFPAFAGALIFAIHPVHTESVAWIKGRDDIQSSIFYLLSFIFFILQGKNKNRSILYYFFSLLFFTAGLFSKEMIVTLPLVLLGYYFFFSREKLKDIKELIQIVPFFLLILAYFEIRTAVLGRVAQGERWAEPLVTLFTMCKGVWLYVKLLFLPVNLCGDYLDFPLATNLTIGVIFFIAVIIGLNIFALLGAKRFKLTSFAIFFFYITLLPVMNIIPINGIIAERFLYIPSIGFSIIVMAFARFLNNNTGNKKQYALISFACICVLFVSATVKRNTVWKNGMTFWADVIKKLPNSRAYTNLGLAYKERGNREKAVFYYRQALTTDPVYRPYAFNNLGVVYEELGDLDRAEKNFRAALKLHRTNPQMFANLANIYWKKGALEKAALLYQASLRVDPSFDLARKKLAWLKRQVEMRQK